MKIKKVLLMFSMLCSLGAISAPILANNQQVNNDTIIVNNEKVNLRQKTIKKANDTSNGANIETTNVDYDLRYLFGGEKNYLKYNIWDLVPTTNDSKDTSFKFICAKPVETNLYLYVYHNDNRNGDILNATFKISKSKTQNSETGEFEEQFSLYNARFINSYGYKQRFMKFAIDNIINTSEDVRCFIENGYITYQDTSTTKKYYSKTYDIHDEFAFGLNNGDYMYEYFKDDYVKITDGEVSLLVTGKNRTPGLNTGHHYYSFNEDFYYFFNTDKDIEELLEIQYDYQLLTYDVHHTFKGSGDYYNSDKEHGSVAYQGLYENDEASMSTNYKFGGTYQYTQAYDFFNEFTTNYVNQKIKQETYVEVVERPSFLWWNQQIEYKVTNIQDCLDTSNLSGEENEGFKTFIDDMQKSRIKDNKSKYSWAFKVCSNQRYVYEAWNAGGWWIFGNHIESNSRCHEVKQALITWLKFRTNNQEFEFNVLDIPKDTTSIYVQDVPFDTLGDVIVENAVSAWNWFKGAFTNIFDNLVPLLISVAVILVVVLCWPILTSFTKALGMAIEQTTTKKKKKPKKKGG